MTVHRYIYFLFLFSYFDVQEPREPRAEYKNLNEIL